MSKQTECFHAMAHWIDSIIEQFLKAANAFRNALNSPAASKKETVQILYVLARTLESLGRVGEALEFYRWLRREDGQFRDVTERIESLDTRRALGETLTDTGGTI